jgi:hypothetical protein
VLNFSIVNEEVIANEEVKQRPTFIERDMLMHSLVTSLIAFS